MSRYSTIRWVEGSVRMLDQRLLPQEVVYRTYSDYQGVAQAIYEMVIRGAPAIGAAAGYGLALAAMDSRAAGAEQLINDLNVAAKILNAARPTAVNLSWAIERILSKVKKNSMLDTQELRELELAQARGTPQAAIETNRKIQ